MSQRHTMQHGVCQKCGITEKHWLDVPCMPRGIVQENHPAFDRDIHEAARAEQFKGKTDE